MTDTSNLKHRGTVSSSRASDEDTENKTEQQPVDDKQNFYFIYTSAKIIIILLICISIYVLYVLNFFETDKPMSKSTNTKGPHFGDPLLTGYLYTREELAKHDSHGSPILLAIMGRVYDVTKGQSYHAGSSYPFFAGIDGTRAFATGEFDEKGLVDDVTELDHDSILSIADWVKTYDEEYTFVGRLIGTYFDEKGEATPALLTAEKLLRNANRQKSLQHQEKVKFPPCNGRFNQAEGQVVWCSNQSGGIERNWVGKPRKYFDPTIRTKRCACVKDNLLDSPLLELYEGCNPQSVECKIHK